jgi:hypothetical protein
MNRFSIVFLRTTGPSHMIQILVSLVPLTDTTEAQSRSGLECLHLRIDNRHNNCTYLITSTTLLVVSPCVVTQGHVHNLDLLKKELWNKNLAKKSTNTQKIELLQAPNERNNMVNGQEEVSMTTSKQFEQAYITLSMMTKIKLTN